MGVTIFRPGARLIIPGVQVYQPLPSAGGAFTGILDSISNVAAAYSLRQLRSAYSGSAVRVRRSSDDAEQDIGFVSGEFDSSSFSSFIGGGSGYVKTWYDQSGNARNVTQTTTANQPLVVLSAVNGKPALDFDGSNDVMTSAPFSALAMPNTILMVHQANAGGGHGFVSNTSDEHALWAGAVTYQVFGGGVGSNPTPLTLPSGTTEIVTPIWSTTNTQFRINGGADLNGGNCGAATMDSIRLGFHTYYMNGYMLEVILINAAISVTDHNTIGNDMATRFGLTWSTVT